MTASRETTKDMELSQVRAWLASQHGIEQEVQWLQQSAGVADFLVGQNKRLRLSAAPLSDATKLAPLKEIPWVPRLWNHGLAEIGNRQQYFALLDYVPGETLYSVYKDLTKDQRQHLVQDLSDFMTALHCLRGDAYDIGHYIPTIPRYSQSWEQGHQRYVEYLVDQVLQMQLTTGARHIIDDAFRYIEVHRSSLRKALGPRLLHNDLHPKNIIVFEGRLAGVIDWECAQYGEPDFELAHLVHWSLCPEAGAPTFSDLAGPLLEAKTQAFSMDVLRARMTIYQLEHEINQLVWCWAAEGPRLQERQLPLAQREAARGRWLQALELRLQRLSVWLEGRLQSLLP